MADELVAADGSAALTTRTDHPEGVIVGIPLQSAAASKCTCNGRDLVFENVFERGQNWAYIVAPAGEARIEILLDEPTVA